MDYLWFGCILNIHLCMFRDKNCFHLQTHSFCVVAVFFLPFRESECDSPVSLSFTLRFYLEIGTKKLEKYCSPPPPLLMNYSNDSIMVESERRKRKPLHTVNSSVSIGSCIDWFMVIESTQEVKKNKFLLKTNLLSCHLKTTWPLRPLLLGGIQRYFVFSPRCLATWLFA